VTASYAAAVRAWHVVVVYAAILAGAAIGTAMWWQQYHGENGWARWLSLFLLAALIMFVLVTTTMSVRRGWRSTRC
jgi:hypothetical protein